jgi:peptidoglycan biosynthesis protein MviN/MurJ (putative lipid II flippase)
VEWADRIRKSVPVGVTAVYLGVVNVIPETQTIGFVLLTALGIVGTALLVARGSQYADGDTKKYPVDWKLVGISVAAFLAWAYSLGWPAKLWGIFEPWIALLALGVTNFVITYLYKGSDTKPLSSSG